MRTLKHQPAFMAAFLALVVDLLLARMPGFKADIDTFTAWAMRLSDTHWVKFFARDYFADYFPLYLYVLTPIGWLIHHLHLLENGWLLPVLKAPAILGHAAICWLIAKRKEGASIGELLWWAFNPGLVYNAAIYGQVDTLFVLLGIFTMRAALAGKLYQVAIFAGLNLAFKPLAVVPLGGAMLLLWPRREEWNKQQILSALAILGTVFIVPFVPFWREQWDMAVPYYQKQFGTYPYAAVNAFNVYSALGLNWSQLKDPVAFHWARGTWCSIGLWSGCLALLAYAYYGAKVRIRSLTSDQGLLIGLAFAFVGYLLAPSMHERYFVVVFPFFGVLPLRSKRLFWVFVVASITLAVDQMAARDTLYGSKHALLGTAPIFTASMLAKLGCLIAVLRELKLLGVAVPAESQEVALDNGKGQTFKPGFRRWALAALPMILIGALFTMPRLGADAIPGMGLNHDDHFRAHFAGSDLPEAIWIFIEQGSVSVESECVTVGQNPPRTTANVSGYREWKDVKIKPCAGVIDLTLKVSGTSVLGELAFRDKNHTTLPVLKLCRNNACFDPKLHALFDEQQLASYINDVRGNSYFDEIYFVRSANEQLQGIYPYEMTHPPFGKDLIAASIKIFGDNPWAWRLPPALTGIATPVILFTVAGVLFQSPLAAAFAGTLALLDCMRLTMSRMGTVDTMLTILIIVAFACTDQFFAGRRRLWQRGEARPGNWRLGVATGFLWGLAAATKWLALYAGPAILVYMAVDFRSFQQAFPQEGVGAQISAYLKKVGWPLAVFFVACPILAYLATYIPLFIEGAMKPELSALLEHQRYMFNYHSQLTSDHPYSSRFYEWAILQRPLLLYQGGLPWIGIREVIVALGNPVIWWSIPVAVFSVFYWRRFGENRMMYYLAIGILSFMAPWMLIGRCTFIYHFMAPSYLGLLLIAGILADLWRRGYRWASITYCVAALAVFVVLLPITAGLEVDGKIIPHLIWFTSWQF